MILPRDSQTSNDKDSIWMLNGSNPNTKPD